MKKFDISLVLMTKRGVKLDFLKSQGLDIRQLNNKVGGNEVLWRLDSGLPQNSSLKQQFKALYRLIPFQKLDGIKDIHAYLDIGMFFDTPMCSLQLPPDSLALLDNSGLTIEVTCYPCKEEQPNN
jgi:hypothetical protein